MALPAPALEELATHAWTLLDRTVYGNPYIPHDPTPPQIAFLLAPHREVLYGGAAGGGKSDALLMAALQYVHVPSYAALLLRKSYADLALPGAIMDRAGEWLQPTDARWVEADKTWVFPSGATLTFGYLQTKLDHYRYQGAEFQFVGFDEGTQFPEVQYRFLNSRLRRLAGSTIPIRLRMGTNPIGPGKPWVHQRFLVEGPAAVPPRLFVPARLVDNPHLDRAEYELSLAELDPVTRAQMLEGDWNARPPGAMFSREWLQIVDAVPLGEVTSVRYWDLAATEEGPGIDPDYTVGVLLTRDRHGRYYVEDLVRKRLSPFHVERLVALTADQDGKEVTVAIEEEPGASGKSLVDHYRRSVIPDRHVVDVRPTGSKEVRARPVSAQAEAGNVLLVRGPWIGSFLDELEAFPDVAHDDQVDALTGAYGVLAERFGTVGKGRSPWG